MAAADQTEESGARTIKVKPFSIFVPFDRVERLGEHLVVEGYAFVNEVVPGEQGVRLKRAAMEAATPDYLRFGCVREMHQKLAAGTALSVLWDEKGAKIQAKIVDPVARLKCEERVYRGFSVGVTPTMMRGKDVEVCDWTETSLVDRPKDPDALMIFRQEGFDPEAEVTVAWLPPSEPSPPLQETAARPTASEGTERALPPGEPATRIERSVKQETNGQYAVYTPDGGTKLAEFKTRAEAEALDAALNRFLEGKGTAPNSAYHEGAMKVAPSDPDSTQRDPTGRKLLESDLKEPERPLASMRRIVIQEGEHWGVWNAERSQRYGLFDTFEAARAYDAELSRRVSLLGEAEQGAANTINEQREREAADIAKAMALEVPQYAGATAAGTAIDPSMKGYAPQYGGATPDSVKMQESQITKHRSPLSKAPHKSLVSAPAAPSGGYSSHPGKPEGPRLPTGLYGGATPSSAKMRVASGTTERVIEKEGDQFVLKTRDGSKRLGVFKTREEAEHREREIDTFKHKDERAAEPAETRHHLIRPEDGKFAVYSPDGKRKLKTFATETEAMAYEWEADPSGEAKEQRNLLADVSMQPLRASEQRAGFAMGSKRARKSDDDEPEEEDEEEEEEQREPTERVGFTIGTHRKTARADDEDEDDEEEDDEEEGEEGEEEGEGKPKKRVGFTIGTAGGTGYEKPQAERPALPRAEDGGSTEKGGHKTPPKGYPEKKAQYADPEHYKYPIDDEKHVRAAWSYINKAKNASVYSSEQLAKIKGRIKSAAKKFGIEISEEKGEDKEERGSGLARHLMKQEGDHWAVYDKAGKKVATYKTAADAQRHEFEQDPVGELGSQTPRYDGERDPLAKRGITSMDPGFPTRENLEGGMAQLVPTKGRKRQRAAQVVPYQDEFLVFGSLGDEKFALGPFPNRLEAQAALKRHWAEEEEMEALPVERGEAPAAVLGFEAALFRESVLRLDDAFGLFRNSLCDLAESGAVSHEDVLAQAEAFGRFVAPIVLSGQITRAAVAYSAADPHPTAREATVAYSGLERWERLADVEGELLRVQGLVADKERELVEARAEIERLSELPDLSAKPPMRYTRGMPREWLLQSLTPEHPDKATLVAEFEALIERAKKETLAPDEAHAVIARMGVLKSQIAELARMEGDPLPNL